MDALTLLTIEEIAQVLKVPKATIYYWVQRKEIPFLKIGKHLRFQRDAVLDSFKQKISNVKETCSYVDDLVKPKSWFGKRNPSSNGSLTSQVGALLKR